MSPTQVVRPDASHDQSLAGFLAEQFGGRGDELELVRAWRGDTTRGVRVAIDGDQVVGMGLVTVLSELDRDTYELPFEADLHDIVGDQPVGVFNILAVSEEVRRAGVGLGLAEGLFHWLVSQRVGSLIGVSWMHGGGHHSGHLFLKGGFAEVGRAVGYYRRFHDATGQRCTVCAPEPCTCEAVLYARRVEDPA